MSASSAGERVDLISTDEKLDFQVVSDIIVNAMRVAWDQGRRPACRGRDQCWRGLERCARGSIGIRHIGKVCLPNE